MEFETGSGIDTSAPLADAPAPAAAPAAEAPASTSVVDTVRAAVESSRAAQARDDQGRFTAERIAAEAAAAAAQKQPPAPKAAQPPVIDPSKVAAPVNENPQAQAASQPPRSWPAKNADLWKTLPPDAQAFLQEREAQIERGFARYEGLTPFAEMAQRQGTTLRDSLSRYVEAEQALAQDIVGNGLKLMLANGADIDKLAAAIDAMRSGRAPAPAQPPAADPRLFQTVEQLNARLREIEIQPIRTQVDQFMADPANKYFDRVEGIIADLLEKNPSMSLKDAYDNAVWIDPSVRAEVLADERKSAQQQITQVRTPQAPPPATRSLSPSPADRQPSSLPRGSSVEQTVRAAVAATR